MFDDTASLWRRQSNATNPDLSLGPSPDDIASQARYARLIALHGLVGFAGLAVICPLAICIVAIGKSHGPSWVLLHKRLMVWIVVPLTVVCITLSYAAGISSPHETPLDSHKVFGLTTAVSVLIAIVTGDYTFVKYFSPKPDKPRKKSPMSIWLHVQAGLGFLFSPALQCVSGLAEWETHVNTSGGAPLAWYIPIVVWSTLAFFPSLLILHWLVRGTYRMSHEGKSFRMAFFPPATPPEAQDDPEARSLREGELYVVDPEVRRERGLEDEEKAPRPRLKATPHIQGFEYARVDSLLLRRAGDKTPGSPRSVSAPSYPMSKSSSNSSSSSTNSQAPLRSPPPPFSPIHGHTPLVFPRS